MSIFEKIFGDPKESQEELIKAQQKLTEALGKHQKTRERLLNLDKETDKDRNEHQEYLDQQRERLERLKREEELKEEEHEKTMLELKQKIAEKEKELEDLKT